MSLIPGCTHALQALGQRESSDPNSGLFPEGWVVLFPRTWEQGVMGLAFPQLRTTPGSSSELLLPAPFSPLPSPHLYPLDSFAWQWTQGGGLLGQRELCHFLGLRWPLHQGCPPSQVARPTGHLIALVSSSGQHKASSLSVGSVLSWGLLLSLTLAGTRGQAQNVPAPPLPQ